MGESNLFMVRRENVDILEKAKKFKFHNVLPTKAEARLLEEELTKEHLEYSGVALTDNYIIKVEPNRPISEYVVKPDNSLLWSDTFSWMRYDEVLWVYTDEGMGGPSGFAHNLVMGAIQTTITKAPRMAKDVRALFVIYPKDEDRAMLVCDIEKFYSSAIRQFKGKIMVSDEFSRFRDEIIKRLPDDRIAGDTPENRKAYYNIIGKKIPKEPVRFQKEEEEDDEMI